MPTVLEIRMGPCLRRDDLEKKHMCYQHIEEHYLGLFSDRNRTRMIADDRGFIVNQIRVLRVLFKNIPAHPNTSPP